MNREQQRFQAAVAAMQAVISTCDQDEAIPTSIASWSVELADALLAELDRTKPEPETPQPDADGWIPHRPGDPMPCDGKSAPCLKFRDGEIYQLDRIGDTAENYCWGIDPGMSDFEIIAWKPA